MNNVCWDVTHFPEDKDNDYRITGELLPKCMRALIVECGKTVLDVDNFILKDGWIDPTRYYIYSKSLDQQKYIQLRHFFDAFEAQNGESMATFVEKDEDVIPLHKCEPYSLIVIDDWY